MMFLSGFVVGGLSMLVLVKATEPKKKQYKPNRSLSQKLKSFNIFN
jgi:hypothetical protein